MQYSRGCNCGCGPSPFMCIYTSGRRRGGEGGFGMGASGCPFTAEGEQVRWTARRRQMVHKRQWGAARAGGIQIRRPRDASPSPRVTSRAPYGERAEASFPRRRAASAHARHPRRRGSEAATPFFRTFRPYKAARGGRQRQSAKKPDLQVHRAGYESTLDSINSQGIFCCCCKVLTSDCKLLMQYN